MQRREIKFFENASRIELTTTVCGARTKEVPNFANFFDEVHGRIVNLFENEKSIIKLYTRIQLAEAATNHTPYTTIVSSGTNGMMFSVTVEMRLSFQLDRSIIAAALKKPLADILERLAGPLDRLDELDKVSQT